MRINPIWPIWLSHRQAKLKGISLIELLIAMTLAVFLLGYIAVIFVNASKNHRYILNLIQLQTSTDRIANLLNSEIQAAGYIGCAQTHDFPLKNPFNFDLTYKIKSDSAGGLVVFHASHDSVNLSATMRSNVNLFIPKASNFFPGDYVVISDCKSADIFQIKAITKHNEFLKVTATQPLQKRYAKDAEINHFEINHYFLNFKNQLIEKDIYQKEEVILDQVSDFKILLDKLGEAILGVAYQLTILQHNFFGYASTRINT